MNTIRVKKANKTIHPRDDLNHDQDLMSQLIHNFWVNRGKHKTLLPDFFSIITIIKL